MMRQTRKAFTLVEILIVVIILGILAAIVIPQFTEASTEAKQSSLVSNLQTLRSQVGLYKIQHNDVLPGVTAGTPDSAPASDAEIIRCLTTTTKIDGSAWNVGDADQKFGPYMQVVPENPFITVDGTASFSFASGLPAALDSSHWYIDTDTGAVYANDSFETSDTIPVEHSTL
jgi:general secretion pathway protein G